MEIGLPLVSVLAGYLFQTLFNGTRYKAARSSGYHVFFQAALTGVLLFAVSYTLVYVFYMGGPRAEWLWAEVSPNAFTDAMALSVVLGFLLPFALNRIIDSNEAARAVARDSGDVIEVLLDEAFENQRYVEVTLRTGKAYVGLVSASPISLGGTADVSLVPLLSGYRNRQTQELRLTRNYAPMLQEAEAKHIEAEHDDFRIVLSLDEVVSARRFDRTVWDRFQEVA